MIVRAVSHVWLARGLKYSMSQWAAGAEWFLPFSAVLAKHHISLNGLDNLTDVIYTFRDKFVWDWDPFRGVGDYVKPPARTLVDGRGDCDDTAMVHAQAIEHALGPAGWKARIVSYLAQPWWWSHHFAVGVDPSGGIWPVQPPPAAWQSRMPLHVWDHACGSFDQAVHEVVKTYPNVGLVWFDVRDAWWQLVS